MINVEWLISTSNVRLLCVCIGFVYPEPSRYHAEHREHHCGVGFHLSAAGAHGQRAGRDGSEVRQPHKHIHTTGITYSKTTDSAAQYMLQIHAVQTTHKHLQQQQCECFTCICDLKLMCANIHCLFLLNTRIDANVEDTQLNVEMAHTEILKYFQSVSSNRWLMIKIFLVLIIFFIIFVVFLA